MVKHKLLNLNNLNYLSISCGYVNLQSTRDSAYVIKLKVLRWGDCLGYLGRPGEITTLINESGGQEGPYQREI